MTNAATIQFAAEFESKDQEFLLLRVRVYFDGRLSFQPGYIVRNIKPNQQAPVANLYCELLDKQNHILTRYRCHQMDPHRSDDDAYQDFLESIPWNSDTKAMRFCRGKEVLGSIDVEDHAPKLTVQAPRVRDGGKLLSVRWNGVHNKSLTYAVR